MITTSRVPSAEASSTFSAILVAYDALSIRPAALISVPSARRQSARRRPDGFSCACQGHSGSTSWTRPAASRSSSTANSSSDRQSARRGRSQRPAGGTHRVAGQTRLTQPVDPVPLWLELLRSTCLGIAILASSRRSRCVSDRPRGMRARCHLGAGANPWTTDRFWMAETASGCVSGTAGVP